MQTEPWSIDQAIDTYRVDVWGDPFFGVSEKGHVLVRPHGDGGISIDLTRVVAALQKQNVPLPFLIRFQDILRARVRQIAGAFAGAIESAGYTGQYCPVYPIKVNQLHEVVEEVLDEGRKVGLGLECGSKAELIAALPHITDSERLLVCNGVKDAPMLELILDAQRLGQHTMPVMEKYTEFQELIRIADAKGVVPRLGVRIRLSTRGSGRWGDSTGTRAKFGLTIPEVMRLTRELESRGQADALQLVHIHAGSQIADIQVLKQTVKEIAQIYASLRKRGINIRYLDVGGGLGVVYDASMSHGEERINYGLEEYANAVIFGVQDVCRQQSVSEPHIVTESGRALTAHHSVLIVPVLGTVRRDRLEGALSPAVLDQPHVRDLAAIHNSLNPDARIGALLEAFHDSKSLRQDLQTLFTLGYLDIECLSASEELYWSIARLVLAGLKGLDLHPPPVELIELEEGLTDQYLCDFSIFQSMLDHWAIDQVFPIMPIDRLDQRPDRRARLVDLTCDSDGKVSHYVSSHPDKSFLPLPQLVENSPMYLGFFLMGAYQDIMGDAHNLYGRVAEAHVYADAEEADNFWIEKVIGAMPVQDMLAQVQYFPNDLDRRMSEFVRAKIEAGIVRPSQGVEILERYRAVFPKSTYCEPTPFTAAPV